MYNFSRVVSKQFLSRIILSFISVASFTSKHIKSSTTLNDKTELDISRDSTFSTPIRGEGQFVQPCLLLDG